MQYLLSLYSDETTWPTMTEEQKKQGYAAYMAYTEALKQANAYKGSNRLQPTSTATTVRTVDEVPKVRDALATPGPKTMRAAVANSKGIPDRSDRSSRTAARRCERRLIVNASGPNRLA